MQKITNKQVAKVFAAYPDKIRKKMFLLRGLVLDVARELGEHTALEETLKWGEPSYLVEGGSPVRMDWKQSAPAQYALYFHCTTTLVTTFKELHSDKLKFAGNRAIVFEVNGKIPTAAVKHCIHLAFTYHRRKHLPMLGV